LHNEVSDHLSCIKIFFVEKSSSPDGQYDHRKRQSTSDFPQRYAHSYQHIVHETESHQNPEDILKFKEQNRQMGIVVQRSIDILEQILRKQSLGKGRCR